MPFKKGVVTNPKGREKGSKNKLTILRERLGADSLKKIHPIMMEILENSGTPKSLKIAIGIPILKIVMGEKIMADIKIDGWNDERIDRLIQRMMDEGLLRTK